MRIDVPTLLAILAIPPLLVACAPARASQTAQKPAPLAKRPGEAHLVLGAGCFWCYETMFESLKGVRDVEVGYAGGKLPNPTYDEISTGLTGHAEVFKVVFDPKKIAAEDILRVFFTVHDPTTLNRQGPDHGTQYRSVIFFESPEERERAQRIIDEIGKAKIWDDPIVTTLEPLKNYARAEEYHQDYYAKFEKAGPVERLNMNSGYCRAIITPKVAKFRQKFAHLMKGD